MTCVLGMVVGREREIRDFKPEDYFKIDALHGDWTSHWKAVKGTRYFESRELYNESGLSRRETAEALTAELRQNPSLTVTKLERKTEKQQAPALFNLAELQAECTKRFKIAPRQTLELAQSLYEKKLTTYPRTDARVLSSAVCKEIEKNILGLGKITGWQEETETVIKNGWHRAIAGNKRYVDDGKITDHYAIIPTGEGAKEYSRLSELEKKVYELIARRFLAVFYPPAVYDKVNVELRHASGEMFFASEKTLAEPGWRAICSQPKKEDGDDEDQSKEGLRNLREGETVKAEFKVENSTTQPPKRYSSGSIILAMEGAGKLIDDAELREQIKGSGIGTSATRAEIIAKLEHDRYISLDRKNQLITPTAIGEALCDIVSETVP
jgi:DNA topoisomerase-3